VPSVKFAATGRPAAAAAAMGDFMPIWAAGGGGVDGMTI